MNNGITLKIPSPNNPEGLRGNSPFEPEKLNGTFPINHKSLSFVEYLIPKPNSRINIFVEDIRQMDNLTNTIVKRFF